MIRVGYLCGGLSTKIVIWVEELIVVKIFDFNCLSEEFVCVGGGYFYRKCWI